jgi:hypothetical protein
MYGGMSFGFSYDLYASTENFVGQVNSRNIEGCASAPPPYPDARECTQATLNTTGYTVFVHDLGIDSEVSGLIPQLSAAQQSILRYSHPEEYSNYSIAVNVLGIDPNQAYHDMIAPHPQAAADWSGYQYYYNQIIQILENYIPSLQNQSEPLPHPLPQ